MPWAPPGVATVIRNRNYELMFSSVQRRTDKIIFDDLWQYGQVVSGSHPRFCMPLPALSHRIIGLRVFLIQFTPRRPLQSGACYTCCNCNFHLHLHPLTKPRGDRHGANGLRDCTAALRPLIQFFGPRDCDGSASLFNSVQI